MRLLLMLLVAVLTALLLTLTTGCATTKMEYVPGGQVSWSSKTLWKDIQEVDVEWGEMSATLGSSTGNGREEVIACLLAPQLCQE